MRGKSRQFWRIGFAAGTALAIAAILLLAVPAGVARGGTLAQTATVANLAVAGHLGSKTSCATGANPEFVAFDPINKWYYVSNVVGGSLSIYKSACTLVATLTFASGSEPRGVAYDPSNNRMYVADYTLNKVYVISGKSIVQTLRSATFINPWGVAYDPSDGYFGGGGSMIVTNGGADNISVLGSHTVRGPAFVYQVIAVGSGPVSVAYSSVYDTIAVLNQGSDNVTFLSASYLTQITSSGVGSLPFEVAFSPATLEFYVTNENNNNVTVLLPDGVEWATINVGSTPYGIAYDPVHLEMYVTNFGGNSISVINSANHVAKTIHLAAGSNPINLAFNSGDNKMDVVGWTSDTVYVVS